jgi:hypothetical protein
MSRFSTNLEVGGKRNLKPLQYTSLRNKLGQIYLPSENTQIREELIVEQKINCAEACVNGCVLGDKCPNIEFRESTSKFIEETSLDKMLEIAEERLRKKMTEPPKWVFPEDS